jgi:hypothetical protein
MTAEFFSTASWDLTAKLTLRGSSASETGRVAILAAHAPLPAEARVIELRTSIQPEAFVSVYRSLRCRLFVESRFGTRCADRFARHPIYSVTTI